MKSPFAVNWRNLDDVIEYAKQLGPDQIVIKHPNRPNYNITFKSRTDLYKPEWVMWPRPQN